MHERAVSGLIVSASSPPCVLFRHDPMMGDAAMGLFGCALSSSALTGAMIVITEYYTGPNMRPCATARRLADRHRPRTSSRACVSMKSTRGPCSPSARDLGFLPARRFSTASAIAATAMLSMTGVIVALDAYARSTTTVVASLRCPGLPKEVRKVTDALDAVGNTTKASPRLRHRSAGLAALVLFADYTNNSKATCWPRGARWSCSSLSDPAVIIACSSAGLIPYLFRRHGDEAVVAPRVRWSARCGGQFREIPGIMPGPPSRITRAA